jgi:hypothetical protein
MHLQDTLARVWLAAQVLACFALPCFAVHLKPLVRHLFVLRCSPWE